MKDWWQNLSARERWFIMLGGGIGVIIIIYLLIISPFYTKISNLKTDLASNKALVNWMADNVNKIKELESRGIREKQSIQQSLLITVNNTLTTHQLAKYAEQITQVGENQIRIVFDNVPFDSIMRWAQNVWKAYNIEISSMTTTPQKTEGLVNATLTVTR